MDIKSLNKEAITNEKANSLFWLGRYIERVFQTIKYYNELFDTMLDKDSEAYHHYCEIIDIPDIYINDAHFITSYLYDINNPDSIYSNLTRAYDNAVVLREEISSPVLSYIQMAMNTFTKMEESDAYILLLQDIIDNIYAFWGCLSDNYEEKVVVEIIKLGKYVEKVDMYSRLGYSSNEIDTQYNNLFDCINKLIEGSDIKGIDTINKCDNLDYNIVMNQLYELTRLFEVL